jgi:putative Holliday junction resolvase
MAHIGIDVGEARIGLAVSQGELVLPVESFQNNSSGIASLLDEIAFRKPELVFVGLPLNLKGDRTISTSKAIEFAKRLALEGFAVRMIDERLTTRTAQSQLRTAGKNSKQSRGIIDAVAAAAILEFALSHKSDAPVGISLEELDV